MNRYGLYVQHIFNVFQNYNATYLDAKRFTSKSGARRLTRRMASSEDLISWTLRFSKSSNNYIY